MAFNPLSGTLAAVKIGATSYAFDKWDVDMNMKLPEVNNFTSPARQVVVGIYKGDIRLEGPYDQGNMPFTVGASVILILQFTSGISITITGLIESIHPVVDVEDAARISMSVKSNGTFTAAIT